MNTYRRSFLDRNVLLSNNLLLAGPTGALAIAIRTISPQSVNQKQANIMYHYDINRGFNSTSKRFGSLSFLQKQHMGNNGPIATLLFAVAGFLNFNKITT
ncbi:hypothetical protein DBR40_03745 [Pedobacter sp. KBW01]|nr:hypothetical protein DBR40_03745 [Pedobacter sp. KBW01]